jgi:hypothetical protein
VERDREDGWVLVHMPGIGYHLEFKDARKLRDSLSSALREAVIQNEGKVHGCHDCGEERYPKLAHGTLVCPDCLSENIVCIDTDATAEPGEEVKG